MLGEKAIDNQGVVKTERKRGKRDRVITITYVNELSAGVLERALADIYARKAKNGKLDYQEREVQTSE